MTSREDAVPFFVEAEELAHILGTANARSLVLLDEVGRGTSTYDGLAIATAATEYLHDHLRALTLFATHYAELTEVADKLPRAENRHVAAEEQGGELVFLSSSSPRTGEPLVWHRGRTTCRNAANGRQPGQSGVGVFAES